MPAMIKRTLHIVLLTLMAGHMATAQQQPHYTQYMMNPFIINPAVAGIENYWDLKVSHRHQWAGIQDAPVTSYLTAHGPLWDHGGDVTATGYPGGRKTRRAQYQAPRSHPGVGLTLLNDVTGPIRRFSFNGTLAQHIRLGERTSLSAGIGVGMQTFSLDGGKLEFGDPGDPSAGGGLGVEKRWWPDVRAGLWLYTADFFAGASAANIIRQDLTFDNGAVRTNDKRGQLDPHIFITAGYRLWLSEDISLLPSLLFRYVSPLPLGVDVNAKVQYRDRVWAGLNYRHQDGVGCLLGVYISPTLNVGYAYDYTASSLNKVSKGSHELTIGLLLRNTNHAYAPRQAW